MAGELSFDATELKPERIARGDPLLRMLTRVKISPILVGIVFSGVFQLVRTLAAWRAGHLRTVGTVMGLFDSPGLYLDIIYSAVLWSYYTWMPRGIVTLFKRLGDNGVIGDLVPPKRGNYCGVCRGSFVEEMQTSFEKSWWSALSLMIAAGVTLTLIVPQYLDMARVARAASIADDLSLIWTFLWALISHYGIALILSYSMLSIYWLRRLFNSFTINVRPLHPDQAGGLSPLGDFTLTLSYLVTFVGILLVINPLIRNYVLEGALRFRWTTDLLAGLGIYVVAAPTIFFAPLSVAHNSMKDARALLLLQIARRFDAEYMSVQRALDGDISGLENDLKTLKELQTLHGTTSKFPVWPFNVANITRFSASFLSPIILGIVTNLIGKVI